MILTIFPNQLFETHPGLDLDPTVVAMIEDPLFFGDARYPLKFHKQKLWLHRATMKRYQRNLQERGYNTIYVAFDQTLPLATRLQRALNQAKHKPGNICVTDPTDFILKKRLLRACDELDVACQFLANPGFLNTTDENRQYRQGKSRWYMADFYQWQRRKYNILMEGDEPRGGQWSFDADNRKKCPKNLIASIPLLIEIERDAIDHEAKRYVETHFPDSPGELDRLYYPTSHDAARAWLHRFLETRLNRFGDFEDAIVQGESWLWHSVLTPSLNIGLLTPPQIVDATVDYASKNDVPLNSLEGFIRQIIGWREFMRATYEDLGVEMRTKNHWGHQRPMPSCFYEGNTGILPIDDTILRLKKTAYCHHIERLMVLGGFMFLCEIDPDEIYRWFMEMFIDSYDWVMVPNVYAMSQNADGGMITTKPYFSGSAYIRKMSHYKQEPWCEIWDGLYWRWIWNHVDALRKNPRWAMMCSMALKMDATKREKHLSIAEAFLSSLR